MSAEWDVCDAAASTEEFRVRVFFVLLYFLFSLGIYVCTVSVLLGSFGFLYAVGVVWDVSLYSY